MICQPGDEGRLLSMGEMHALLLDGLDKVPLPVRPHAPDPPTHPAHRPTRRPRLPVAPLAPQRDPSSQVRTRLETFVLLVWGCSDGMVYYINDDAPAARGKLPRLSAHERLLTMPRMKIIPTDEGDAAPTAAASGEL